MSGPEARFLRACRRRPVDATPVWFMRQAGRALPEFRVLRAQARFTDLVGDPALAAEITLQPVRRLGVDAAIVFADLTTPLAALGVAVDWVDGQGPVVVDPLRGPGDLARFADVELETAVGPTLEAIRLVRAASPVPLIGFAGAPFTVACYLIEGRPSRDLLTMRRLVHARPRFVAALLDRLADLTIGYAAAQVHAGVQALQLFDSWVGVLAQADYRRHVAPVMGRIWTTLAPLGVPLISFGTGTAHLIEPLAAAGGDVIGLDWRVGLAEGWARIGPQRAVQGNLDPTVLFGPWSTVADRAEAILTAAAGRPGHIFNLGHGVLPGTDPDVLRRLVDHVHDKSRPARWAA